MHNVVFFPQAGKGQWLAVIPDTISGITIPSINISSPIYPTHLQFWNDNAPNGLRILGDNIIIEELTITNVHVGIDIQGDNVQILKWTVTNVTGDVFQGNTDTAALYNGTIHNLLESLPYAQYHPDVGQWRTRGSNIVIDGVEVVPTSHPWARKSYQGIMFTDPLDEFKYCTIRNLIFPDGSPIHAVTFADASFCSVQNVDAPGYVNFRELRGIRSINNITNAKRDYFMTKIFDPVHQFKIDSKNIQDTPVAILFNNPGAIVRYGANKWLGAIYTPESLLDYQRSRRQDLERFEHPQRGIRAIAIILLNKRRRGLNTVRKIIEDYAPPSRAGGDNSNQATENYVQTVAKAVGVDADTEISVFDWYVMFNMVRAIVSVECAKQDQYPDEMYNLALIEAGVPAPGEEPIAKQVKPIAKSQEVQSSKVVVGAGAAGAAGTVATITKVAIDNADQVTSGIAGAPIHWLVYVLLCVNLAVMIGVGVLGWRIYSRRKLSNDLDIV
jgi:hypothetical protein